MTKGQYFRNLLVIASWLGAIGVIFGAFGAHALKARLAPGDLEAFKTGVLYLFIHVFAALFTGWAGLTGHDSGRLKWAGITFIAGIILFSGSLFLLTTQEVTGLHLSFLGPITPIGGACFIAGWVLLAPHGWNQRR